LDKFSLGSGKTPKPNEHSSPSILLPVKFSIGQVMGYFSFFTLNSATWVFSRAIFVHSAHMHLFHSNNFLLHFDSSSQTSNKLDVQFVLLYVYELAWFCLNRSCSIFLFELLSFTRINFIPNLEYFSTEP
jgi:hypothetical protein